MKVRYTVWFSTMQLRTPGWLKKRVYKRTGPYTMTRIINKNAYEFDLPNTMRNHNAFHVSLLDRYAPPVAGQWPSEAQPTIVHHAAEREWEVKCIIDAELGYRKLHYLVQWVGYYEIHTTWEPTEYLENAQELVDSCHQTHPKKLRRKGIKLWDSDVEEMSWGLGLGSRRNASIGWTLLLHFSSRHFVLWVWPGSNGLGIGCTTFGLQWSRGGSSPCGRFAEWSRILFPLLFSSLYDNIQPRRPAHREGMM